MAEVKQFPAEERALPLGVRGVGPAVIGRLEPLGDHDLRELAEAGAAHIVKLVGGLPGSSCWQNNPQARGAIEGSIAASRVYMSVWPGKAVRQEVET